VQHAEWQWITSADVNGHTLFGRRNPKLMDMAHTPAPRQAASLRDRTMNHATAPIVLETPAAARAASAHVASTEPPFDAGQLPLMALMAHALDELDYGIVIVDRHGRVVKANHMARCQCAGADSACVLQGERLGARHLADGSALQHAIQLATTQAKRSLLTLGGEHRHETVAVVPLGGAGEPAVMLVFGKRQVCEALSVDHYARVHGLTHAESMVLGALCEGDKPLEVAQRFGVAVSTVRTQISSIRQKTQTASIRDLVRQIAVLPPIISALGRAQTH
jgi:DNA-binding CsgD family transcriptional regulator